MTGADDFHKRFLDNLYDGVYFVDHDRVITSCNKGAQRINNTPVSRCWAVPAAITCCTTS